MPEYFQVSFLKERAKLDGGTTSKLRGTFTRLFVAGLCKSCNWRKNEKNMPDLGVGVILDLFKEMFEHIPGQSHAEKQVLEKSYWYVLQ